ncbi:VOC family protein [Bdellovibrio sp. HCB209]|uniref:VOC family protein n=1 Tax=Bdellovibrio sp. HCB209 TaxID=3394354 RepID=UPI0039B5BF7B
MLQSVLINIDVDDITKAIQFYTDGLGLRLGRRFDNNFVELLGLPSPIYLLQNDSGTVPFPNAKESRNYSRHWSPLHLDFIVDNIEADAHRVVSHGAKIEREITVKPYGKIAQFSDPFGHGFCLIEFSPKGYDALL